jgi:lipopolysaccharide export system ATP-binding protein
MGQQIMDRLLEVKGLMKIYGHRAVVNDVDFEVAPGEIVGLLGPNGAGKTTSFRMTVGMITPNAGKVLLSGEDITNLPMYQRARRGMGYLAQETSIFQRLSVQDNILAILETMRMRRAERRAKTAELLRELGLTRLAESKAYTLSGGEKRRLEIARSLVTSPSILLLDEPFTGVDPIAVFEIQKIILALKRRGIGVLLTDQSVRETLSITDRSYIINDGRILTSGTSEQLAKDAKARKFYLGERFKAEDFKGEGLR